MRGYGRAVRGFTSGARRVAVLSGPNARSMFSAEMLSIIGAALGFIGILVGPAIGIYLLVTDAHQEEEASDPARE